MEEKICCSKCGRILEQWEIDNLGDEKNADLCSDCLVAQEGEEMSKTPHK